MDKYENARKAWHKKHLRAINIKLNVDSDADIIAYWSSLPDKANVFREMVRERMKGKGA